MKRTLFTLLILAAGVPPALQAQATLSAVVHDVDGRPLGGVEVSIPSLNLRATTDSLGRARIPALSPGAYNIRARRVGFEPFTGRVQLDGSTPEQTIVLKPITVTLDTIRINGACPWRGFSGWECRRKEGKGLFLDYVAIDSAKVDDVAKLFYDRPDFKVNRANRTGIPYVVSTYKGGRCLVILVNGLPANATTNRPPKYAAEVIGVEAYASPQDVPRDYVKFSWKGLVPCGLVNYWTSSR